VHTGDGGRRRHRWQRSHYLFSARQWRTCCRQVQRRPIVRPDHSVRETGPWTGGQVQFPRGRYGRRDTATVQCCIGRCQHSGCQRSPTRFPSATRIHLPGLFISGIIFVNPGSFFPLFYSFFLLAASSLLFYPSFFLLSLPFSSLLKSMARKIQL